MKITGQPLCLMFSLLEEIDISVDEFRAIGGGAKSRKWLQIKADLYGKKMASLKVSEAASLGAVIPL